MRSINNPLHECKRLNLKISINGELYFSCALCVALKSALRGNPKPPLQDQKYIKYLNFEFTKEHFRTAEGVSRAAHGGVNDASKAAEQKDAYGAVQSSVTEAVKQKRANSKEAANEKAARKKAPTKARARHFCKKRASFSPDGSRKKDAKTSRSTRSGVG